MTDTRIIGGGANAFETIGIAMSADDLLKADIAALIQQRKLSQAEAADVLGVITRQLAQDDQTHPRECVSGAAAGLHRDLAKRPLRHLGLSCGRLRQQLPRAPTQSC